MAKLSDLLPRGNFEDRTGFHQSRPWYEAQTKGIPDEFMAIQRKWIEESGRAITQEESEWLWQHYKQGRLANFLEDYREGPPPMLAPRR